jgi:NhaP-type Na+/H+ or K+/H+ antiporter
MTGLVVLAAVAVGYALLAGQLDRWWISAPMVFVAAGIVLGGSGTGALPFALDNDTTLAITQLTLALLLFADAATVRFGEVERDARLPARLLCVGLPLTVVLGAVLAHLMLASTSWAAAALLASILAPTDTALGLAVVTNRSVPARIRRSLNVESGLNDGLATPFVTMFLAGVTASTTQTTAGWVSAGLRQVGLALLAAIVIGAGGGALLSFARSHGWSSEVSEQLGVLALSLLAYEGAVDIGGNGFVAAFAGGLLFGAVTRRSFAKPVELTETVGLFSSFLVWTICGAVIVGPVLTERISWTAVAYAVLSLTLVRMLPVAIALTRTGFAPSTFLFMGWFGPRGLASVVFTLIAVEELQTHGLDTSTLVQAATWTILFSVVAHGLTATPLARRYGAIANRWTNAPELQASPEPSVRLRDLAGRRRDVGHKNAPVADVSVIPDTVGSSSRESGS